MKLLKNLVFLFLIFLITLPAASYATSDTNFTILPGDVLHINVWKEEGMDHEVVVLPDGTITFPLVGMLNVKGMKPSELQMAIRNRLEFTIPDAAVTVMVKAALGHKISVIGEVTEPGAVLLSGQTGVMEALSQVGGLTPFADEDDIVIIRKDAQGKKQRIEYPYRAIAKGKQLDKDINLVPGDIIVVPSSGLF